MVIATGWGEELRILSPLPSAKIPGSGAGTGQVEEGVLSPACCLGLLTLLSLSALLVCWLNEVTPCESSCPGRGLPSRLHGPSGVLDVPINKCLLPHSFPHGASCSHGSQSLGEEAKFSLALFQLLQGGSSLSTFRRMAACLSDIFVLC